MDDVTLSIPKRSLGKTDFEFIVNPNGEIVGRLKLSNGTVVWVPKNAQYGYNLGWIKFDERMQEHTQHKKG